MDFINGVYELFEQLHVSFTGIALVGIALLLSMFFAVREASSWFLKVDDLKADLSDIQASLKAIEAEINRLHVATKTAPLAATVANALAEKSSRTDSQSERQETEAPVYFKLPLQERPAAQFRIDH